MRISLALTTVVIFSLLYLSCEKNSDVSNDFIEIKENDIFPSETTKDKIIVSNVPELMATATLTKSGNKVVIIKDGTYELEDQLWLTGDNIIFRSESGKRERVVLKGKGHNGSVGWVFNITGKNFAVKDLCIGNVKYHGIQVHGENNADSVHIRNVHFFNIGQQMLKVSYNEEKYNNHADYGIVEDCFFEYTESTSFGYYCGGIDVHHGNGWTVNNNVFKNISSPEQRLTEGAIHFWNHSGNATIKNNTIINCDRGIMLGFDDDVFNGGLVINNMVTTNRDVGIYLCNAKNVKVYNNSILIRSDYKNAIEYRFSGCENIDLINNLTNKAITSRDKASAYLDNNCTTALTEWFKSPDYGNLHLSASPAEVINVAKHLTEVSHDIDGDERKADFSDIGADEK